MLHKHNSLKQKTSDKADAETNEYVRAKIIRFHISLSVYKKFMILLDIQKNIEINIVYPGFTFEIGKMKIEVTKAYHHDIISDKYCLGFLFHVERILFIYTGDTGYNNQLKNDYIQIKKNNKNKEIVLLAHFGGLHRNEESFYRSKDDSIEKAYYPNHLGRLGLIQLLKILEPIVCIISEFGDEFKSARIELCNLFKAGFLKTTFLPADVGMKMDSHMCFYSIDSFSEDTCNYKYLKHDQIEPILYESNSYSIYYYNKNLLSTSVLNKIIKIREKST